MITYSDLDTELQNLIGSLSNIKAGSSVRKEIFNRVLQDLSLFANWKFCIRRTTFNYLRDIREYSLANYLGITDYKAPYELGGIPFIDDKSFYPQRVNTVKKSADLGDNSYFSRMSTKMIDAVHYLVLNLNKGTSLRLSSLDALTDDGAWTATGDAISLAADAIEYRQGSAALKFRADLSHSVDNYAGVKNTTITVRDLSDYEDSAYFLLKVYIPVATDFTSVQLRWGENVSNYWYKTMTAPVNKSSIQAGWNYFIFSWENATKVGSPDSKKLGYYGIRCNYAAGYTDNQLFRIDDLVLNSRYQIDFDYFSRFMIQDEDGAWKFNFEESTDEFVGPEDCRAPIIEMAYNELLRTTRRISAEDKVNSINRYRFLRAEMKKNYGISITSGPKKITTRR